MSKMLYPKEDENNININMIKTDKKTRQEEYNNELLYLHRCLGHLNFEAIIRNLKNGKFYIKNEGRLKRILKGSKISCDVCNVAKFKSRPRNPRIEEEHHGILRKIAVDFKGYFPKAVTTGATGAYIFTDVNTNFVFVYLVKNQDEFAEALQACAGKVSSLGSFIQYLLSDGGTYYTSYRAKAIMNNLLTSHQTSAPYNQWMNGKVERMIGTLMNRVRAMLADGDASEEVWGHAMVHAAFLLNHTPREGSDKSAMMLLKNVILDIGDLPIFYAKCFERKHGETNPLKPRSEFE